jgi:hypothetical protein
MLSKGAPVPRRRLMVGLTASIAVAVMARAQTAGDDIPPTRVTSDSPEFCAQLADQLRHDLRARQPAPVPDEVRMLGHEGNRMCREGHIRPGILRIRRALMLLRGDTPPP